MQERKSVVEEIGTHTGTYGKLTLGELEKYLKDLFTNYKPKKYLMQLWADDYLFLSDESFKAFVTNPDVKFIGGEKGCRKMLARCKKLGIEINK